MKTILVTQRVDLVADYDERRDALDQDWVALVQEAGLVPELVPNNRAWVERRLAAGPPPPLLLTGGDSLAVCGGLVPERDQVEGMLLEAALAGDLAKANEIHYRLFALMGTMFCYPSPAPAKKALEMMPANRTYYEKQLEKFMAAREDVE